MSSESITGALQAKNTLNNAPSRRWPTYLTWLLALVALMAPTVAHVAFGFGVAPVLTGSMRPTMAPGDLFLTKITRADELQVGNVVALHNPSFGSFYAHRIVRIEPYNGVLRISTKGDANPTLDRDPVLVARNANVQRSVGRVKWIGIPLAFISSAAGLRLGATLLIGANALALMVFALRRRWPHNTDIGDNTNAGSQSQVDLDVERLVEKIELDLDSLISKIEFSNVKNLTTSERRRI